MVNPLRLSGRVPTKEQKLKTGKRKEARASQASNEGSKVMEKGIDTFIGVLGGYLETGLPSLLTGVLELVSLPFRLIIALIWGE